MKRFAAIFCVLAFSCGGGGQKVDMVPEGGPASNAALGAPTRAKENRQDISIISVETDPNPFSPNHDGVKDLSTVFLLAQVNLHAIKPKAHTSREDDEQEMGESDRRGTVRFEAVGVAEITGPSGSRVRLISGGSELRAPAPRPRRKDQRTLSVSLTIPWDGLDTSGRPVPEAAYGIRPFAALIREKQSTAELSPAQRIRLDLLRDSLIVSSAPNDGKLKISLKGGFKPEVKVEGRAALTAEQRTLTESLKNSLSGSSKDLRVEVKIMDVATAEAANVTLDTTPPRLIPTPGPGSIQTDSALSLNLDFEESGSAVDPDTLLVEFNGDLVTDRIVANPNGATSSLVPLTSGVNVLQASVQDLAGNIGEIESEFEGPPGLPSPPSQCAGLPDLQILQFDQRPINPRPGQRVEVFAQIRNKGFAPACDFRVKFEVAAEGFFKDYVELGTKIFTGCLAPGQSALVSRQSIPTLPTLIHYRVTVDSLDQVAECDETNNVKADCFSMLTRIWVPTPRKKPVPIPVRNRRPGKKTVIRVGARSTPEFGAVPEPFDVIFEPGDPVEGGVVINIQPQPRPGFLSPHPGRRPPVIGTTPIEIRTSAPEEPLERIVVQPVPIEILPNPVIFTYDPPVPPELVPLIEDIVRIIREGGNPRIEIQDLLPRLPEPSFQPPPPGGGGSIVTSSPGSPPPSPPPPVIHPKPLFGEVGREPLPTPGDYKDIIVTRLPPIIRDIQRRYPGQIPSPLDRIIEDIIACTNLVNDAILANSEGDLEAGLAFLDESVTLLRGVVDFIGESLALGLIDQGTSNRWTNLIEGIIQLVLDLEEMKKAQDQQGIDSLEEGLDEVITLVDQAPEGAFTRGGREPLRKKLDALKKRLRPRISPGFQQALVEDVLPAVERFVDDPGLEAELTGLLSGLLTDSTEGGLASIDVELADPLAPVVLRPGETIRLMATCRFAFGDSTDCTGRVAWQSQNPGVAVSLGDGLFEASAVGTVSAFASSQSVTSNDFEFYVIRPTPFVTGVQISGAPPTVTMSPGTTTTLIAGCSFSDATSSDCTERVQWQTTDPAVAQVTVSNGTATLEAGTPGTALISGSVDGATSDFVAVTVPASPVGSVTGFTFPGYLNFDPATGGYISSLTPLSYQGTPYVLGPPIAPSPASVYLVPAIGGEPTFVLADNTSVPGVDGVTDFGVALLSIPFGNITAKVTVYAPFNLPGFQQYVFPNLPPGTVVDAFIENILVPDERGFGYSYIWNLDRAEIIIAPPPPTLTAISITASQTTVRVGESAAVSALCAFQEGFALDCTRSVNWSSSMLGVGQVSGDGVFQAIGPGTTTLTATKDGVVSNSLTMTVLPRLNSIFISAPQTTVNQYTSTQLSAVCSYSDGSQANCTTQVVWSSTMPSVGTVDVFGVFSAVAPGTTSITASMDGITSQSVIISVASPDTISPETSIEACPNATTNETTATFAFSSTEFGSTFQCELDGGGFFNCAPPRIVAPLSDGSHVFRVRAIDESGNVDPSPATCTWVVDSEPPMFAGLVSATAVSSSEVDLAWDSATDNLTLPDDIVYDLCQATIPGGCFMAFSASYTSTPGATTFNMTGLSADTLYYFVVRAKDRVGNRDFNAVEKTATTHSAGIAQAVAAGGYHTCVLTADGSVKCFGGGLPEVSTPEALSTLVDVVALSKTHFNHTCALISDGTVKCWGRNHYGQLGDGTTEERVTPVAVLSLSGAIAVTGGLYHTCALISVGMVECWGANGSGQLGVTPATGIRTTPVAVSTLVDAVAITAGDLHTCALISDGTAKCWGFGGNGELGGVPTGESTPITVSSISGAVAIAGGYDHTCALASDGTARCWGANESGQLGDGTFLGRLFPAPVAALADAVAISAGGFHTCAIISDGTARCWGLNSSGQVGDGTTVAASIPVAVSGLSDGVAVTAGVFHTCALISDGTVECWGAGSVVPLKVPNLTGRKGVVARNLRRTEGSRPGRPPRKGLSLGGKHACVLISDGSVKCWGGNHAGQLGIEGAVDSTTPVEVPFLSNVVSLGLGDSHSCAVLSSGMVKCWGEGSAGQLGDGLNQASAVPRTVCAVGGCGLGGLEGVVDIGVGADFSCALVSDGSVKCWGRNESGQLGDGTTFQRSTPVGAGGGLTGIVAFSAGGFHSCAQVSDGKVECWGANASGQLGNGEGQPDSSLPVAVCAMGGCGGGDLAHVVAIGLGEAHSCALLADGTVVCWGATFANTPVAVAGASTAVALSSGIGRHTCAVMVPNGDVKCWGDNSVGQLGDGTTMSTQIPVTVCAVGGCGAGQLSPVVAASAGAAHSCALLSTGAVNCWGSNDPAFAFGSLGSGSPEGSLVPVNVVGLP